uniref:Uncharacterized protein n=1 Tax=Leersia perrieri TaxID=77586 RepID=A0A0D9W2H2_9ORYZ
MLSQLLLKIEESEHAFATPASDCWCINYQRGFQRGFKRGFQIGYVKARVIGPLDRALQQLCTFEPSLMHQRIGDVKQVHQAAPLSIAVSDIVRDHQMEQNSETIIKHIMMNLDANGNGTDGNIGLVAIVGAAGIGKTTLANIIFNSDQVHNFFDARIWLNVTANFSDPDLLQSAISSISDGNERFLDMSSLSSMFHDMVKSKRVLLVMDDVWSDNPWNDLLQYPLSGCCPGSCVILTTRNENVAAMMKATHIHQVHKLKLDASWSLLKNLIISRQTDERMFDGLENIGKKILEKCDGLPHAIKLVAGELQQKRRTKAAWEYMLKDQQSSQKGLPEVLYESIYLSYDDLSPHLKQCFLYCSVFPEGETINCDKVVQMWIAEGFIPTVENSKLPEALGQEYYTELVTRNLLEPIDGNFDECCWAMHSVFHSFAQYLAEDETLALQEGQNTSDLHEQFLRISVSSKKVEYNDIQKQKLLRSLVSFGSIILKPGDSLTALQNLQILHVNNTEISTLLGSLCHLERLKYLDLSNTDVSALPHSIGKMKYLQYICVRGCQKLDQLPKSIVNLQKLRFLDISDTLVKTVPKYFGRIKNLVSLKGFPTNTDHTGKCNLEELEPLSQLMHLTLRGLQNISAGSSFASAKLCDKRHLKTLWLCCTASEGDERQSHELFNEVCPSPSLQHLTITGYFGRRLPKWLTTTSLENLRMLKLENLTSCKELPNSLGQLPNMESLCVQHAPCIRRIREELFFQSTFGDDSDEDEGNIRISAAFPKLIKLVFHGLVGLRKWDWNAQLEAMRALQNLHISSCKLTHLPPGLSCQTVGLRVMKIERVKELRSVENFSSVVELYLHSNSNLEKIANLPTMQMLRISKCPKMMVLEEVKALSSMELKDYEMRTLPEYLKNVQLRQLKIDCKFELLYKIGQQDGTLEWEKISHIQNVEAYADGFDDDKRLYTRKTWMKQKVHQNRKIITRNILVVVNFQLPSNVCTKVNHLHFCEPGGMRCGDRGGYRKRRQGGRVGGVRKHGEGVGDFHRHGAVDADVRRWRRPWALGGI